MERLRRLSEDECYLRCYGWRGTGDSVRLLQPASRADVRLEPYVAGERLRRLPELRLDAREPAEAA